MAPNELAEWYWNVPRLSRYWFTGSVVLPLLGRIGLLSPLLNDSSLLYYPISPQTGFHYLINLYFLYSYSTALESAEYAFLLLFCWICLVALALRCWSVPADGPDGVGRAVHLVPVKSGHHCAVLVRHAIQSHVPALGVLLAFNMIIQGGGFTELLGILVGHLYFFLAFKYPQDLGGRQADWRLRNFFIACCLGNACRLASRRREDGTDGAGDDERRVAGFRTGFPGGWTPVGSGLRRIWLADERVLFNTI
uniref:Derlin n=1 Tax=Macrostomum lignano TaxID=282301 RepID=A0A1I8FMG5_9PLAT